jgi:ABC-type glycerol-3-phosphate transport system permease component
MLPGDSLLRGGLFAFTGQYQNNWTLMAAAMFIVASPLIAAYIAGLRFIVSDIMTGGLKA